MYYRPARNIIEGEGIVFLRLFSVFVVLVLFITLLISLAVFVGDVHVLECVNPPEMMLRCLIPIKYNQIAKLKL